MKINHSDIVGKELTGEHGASLLETILNSPLKVCPETEDVCSYYISGMCIYSLISGLGDVCLYGKEKEDG